VPAPPRTVAVCVAGGAGVRMGAGLPKAIVPLAGRPMLAWSLEALAASDEVDAIVLVAPMGREAELEHAVGAAIPLHRVVHGGTTRSRSVLAGLSALPEGTERVLVHDAARPLLTPALVAAVLAGLAGVDGAIAASPLADTLKRVGEGDVIAGTAERAGLWRAETPQAFPAATLRDAFTAADAATLDAVTDCAGLVEARGGRVRVVPSPGANLKVTTPVDLEVAEALLRARVPAG
jgi:2-C-methyl-D-erythritol 4-phosphate cytidylyltransferase